ncbi:hypothetical protein [Marivivens marinus]|uniref:hypothetical protein n=1 Tax=Marivivens marinus TaxID=3110173 RepID=UPI003B8498BC
MSRSAIRRARRGAGRGKRRSRRNGSDLKWFALIAVLASIVVGGFLASDYYMRELAVDDETLCPVDGPEHATLVLLDLTDPISAAQSSRLRTILGGEIARAPAGTMFSVGVVSEDPTNWGARFARCKPQQEENANPLIQNPRMIGERYNDEFIVPFDQAIGTLLTVEAENSSPIMESLQALVADSPSIETVPGRRKLIVVSDLLQNSQILSFFREEYWEEFASVGGVTRLAGDLHNVEVMILRIPRQTSQTGEDRVDQFWIRYFDFQGTNGSFDVRILGDL